MKSAMQHFFNRAHQLFVIHLDPRESVMDQYEALCHALFLNIVCFHLINIYLI